MVLLAVRALMWRSFLSLAAGATGELSVAD